ncbi:hypothetical protein M9435_005662 [Picochlorum sp. BPE23]|nr:hypothetical protein M9435_005662 [Picochlorum sp. BPE23]
MESVDGWISQPSHETFCPWGESGCEHRIRSKGMRDGDSSFRNIRIRGGGIQQGKHVMSQHRLYQNGDKCHYSILKILFVIFTMAIVSSAMSSGRSSRCCSEATVSGTPALGTSLIGRLYTITTQRRRRCGVIRSDGEWAVGADGCVSVPSETAGNVQQLDASVILKSTVGVLEGLPANKNSGARRARSSGQRGLRNLSSMQQHSATDHVSVVGADMSTPHDKLMALVSRVMNTKVLSWLVAKKNKAPLMYTALCAIPFLPLPPAVVGAWNQITSNYVFVVGFWGWFLAQFFKIFTKWYKTGIFSVGAFFDSGGMPSSHSSLCAAVTTAVGIHHGLGSSLFAVCTCFSVIVMYDAMGVRRHAGLQAQVLNAVVNDLLEGHPVSERKLKEVLGHTPRQVMCGAILGLTVGLLFPCMYGV